MDDILNCDSYIGAAIGWNASKDKIVRAYFISQSRAVPRFLFIYQPSQVNFPSDFDAQNTDKEEVNNLY